LVQIGNLIQDPSCRLLTLLGPGGSGKTRLAIQSATKTLRSFPDGTYFVPLESSYSADYLIPTIADALQFNIDTIASELDPKTQLLDYLRNRSILFVMDGFEGLISGAGLISDMLGYAPNIQVLVTSRQGLDLKGEWTFLVEGLPVPQNPEDTTLDDSGAGRLFTERAQQAKMGFQLSCADCEDVTRICQFVDGMPLGIELAAAWTSMLSPFEIAEEMEKSLDFLSTSLSDIPEKHRSLRAVFDSSWLMLTDEQQETVSKLSIFRGGFDRQAAMQVAGASLPQLSALMDKSLLRRNEAGYFSMHGLLRQFANEKLNQLTEVQEDVHHRHCCYFINMLTQREADFMGPRMLKARDDIRQEMGNVQAAVYWASLHWEPQAVRKVLLTLLCFYIVQGWHEGIDAFRDIARLRREALLTRDIHDPSKDQVILSARIHQAFFYSNLGQIDESEAISRDCYEAFSELELRGELSECLHNLGLNASFRGEYENAREYLEEAILLGRECDHIVWPTYLLWLGHVYFLLGEYDQGLLSLRKSHELFERRGTLWGIAFALSKIGLASDGLGEHPQAMKYHREAYSIFERVGNPTGKGYSLSRMSMSAYFLEIYPQAVQFGQEGYRIFLEIGHRWGKCTSLYRLGFAYIGLGDTEKAKEYLFGALEQSRENQMVPLCLYALTGLACSFMRDGDETNAVKLLNYVRHHPQIPAICLDLATPWFVNQDLTHPHGGDFPVDLSDDPSSLENVIDCAS
jgi:predicted ATPase/tetratricopeptide (TPR) repeat protein